MHPRRDTPGPNDRMVRHSKDSCPSGPDPASFLRRSLKLLKIESSPSLRHCGTTNLTRRSNFSIRRCEQFPGNAELWTMQGVAYAGRGTKERSALVVSQRAEDIPGQYPGVAGSCPNRIRGRQRGRDSPAATFASLAARRRHHQCACWRCLEYQQGNCEAAVPFISQRPATLFESRPEGLHAYATCLVKLKQFDEAADIFQEVCGSQSGDRRERQLLASIQLMAHKPQDALATLDPLLGTNQRRC